MKTKKDKQRRCLKFVGYIFVPYEEELVENPKHWYKNNSCGRITFYDEKGEKEDGKAHAFGTFSGMLQQIEKKRLEMFKKHGKMED